MYIAPGQGLTTPSDEIFMSTETSCHFGHLLQVWKKSLIDFIPFFSWFMYVYSPRAGADNTLGTKFWCQQEHPVTSIIFASSKKHLFEVWFYTIFFMILYMYIAPGQGQTYSREESFDVNINVLSLYLVVVSLKKMSVKFDFIHFIHDLIHLYSSGAGTDSPQGKNLDVNRKALSLYPTVASFKEISLKSDFIEFFFFFFFHNLIHVYSPWAGGIQPPGDKVLMSPETSCHFGHLLLVSNHRWQ